MNPTPLNASPANANTAGALLHQRYVDEAHALDDADQAVDVPASPWPQDQSFCTQFCFALDRPQSDAPAAGPAADLRQAARIAGTYTVSFNAASGLLVLSGTLNVDGATYFIDDQLSIDQTSSYDAYLSAGTDDRRLTAWSVGGMPEQGPALKMLAGLAVMAHLGLRRHG